MTTTQLAPVQPSRVTQDSVGRGTKLPANHTASDAQRRFVGGNPTTEQVASLSPMPTAQVLPVRTQRAESTADTNTQPRTDSAPSSGSNHGTTATHGGDVVAGSNPPPGHSPPDTHQHCASGGHSSTEAGAMVRVSPNARSPRPGGWLRDPVLGVLADVLNDLESIRIANTNRVRILTRNEADSDGEERGHGLTEDHPEVAKLILTVRAMEQLEHDATLNLQRAMRKHPLGPFVKRTVGLGEKQTARLIATLGDPYWNDLHNKPRTVSELWAYCGFHVLHPGVHSSRETHPVVAAGVAPKRTRGQKSNWSEDARKRTWLIASAIPKFKDSPYEPVYRAARVKYADTVHPSECVRCGPKGKPAPAGSPLSLGHQNARAHRIVAKEILKDLWRESHALYEVAAS